jgi:hypothetical protein
MQSKGPDKTFFPVSIPAAWVISVAPKLDFHVCCVPAALAACEASTREKRCRRRWGDRGDESLNFLDIYSVFITGEFYFLHGAWVMYSAV